jgi:hypothetical protein
MALNAKANPNYVPKRINGKFAPGSSGNPGGSVESSRRSLNRAFLLDFAEHWKVHGRKALDKAAKDQPAAYIKIAALLVPRQMEVEHKAGVKGLTDEQLEGAIQAVTELLEARAKGVDAKLIEAKPAEPSALLPSPTK